MLVLRTIFYVTRGWQVCRNIWWKLSGTTRMVITRTRRTFLLTVPVPLMLSIVRSLPCSRPRWHFRISLFLLARSDTGTPEVVPNLRIPASTMINEYKEPNLFPGMFPSLYPQGIRGLSQSKIQPVLLSSGPRPLPHSSFLSPLLKSPVVHFYLSEYLSAAVVQKSCSTQAKYSDCEEITRKLQGIRKDPQTILQVAKYIENEGSVMTLSPSLKDLYNVFQKIITVGAKIPSSDTAKRLSQTEICAYISLFGVLPLFLTLNPSVANSCVETGWLILQSTSLVWNLPQSELGVLRGIRWPP